MIAIMFQYLDATGKRQFTSFTVAVRPRLAFVPPLDRLGLRRRALQRAAIRVISAAKPAH